MMGENARSVTEEQIEIRLSSLFSDRTLRIVLLFGSPAHVISPTVTDVMEKLPFVLLGVHEVLVTSQLHIDYPGQLLSIKAF